jgi:hypothetical protein
VAQLIRDDLIFRNGLANWFQYEQLRRYHIALEMLQGRMHAHFIPECMTSVRIPDYIDYFSDHVQGGLVELRK